MGDKAQARETAKQAGAPVVPGSEGPLRERGRSAELADRIGHPVMLKAAAGGGGRGTRTCESRDDLPVRWPPVRRRPRSVRSATSTSKFLDEARHVAVQVLGHRNGIRIHPGERDRSIQRRHQNSSGIAAPSISGDAGRPPPRRPRGGQCRHLCSACSAEFLVARDGSFYFIEMNTRIQVEHPVTELLTGLDIVREQIRIAAGEPLGYKQDAVRFVGHALECRINAEDPETFVPSPGRVTVWVPPGGRNVRVDSHLLTGYTVPPHYDSLVAKIIVHGTDRADAIARMQRALAETLIEGVKTTIPYHQKLLSDPAFVSGEFTLPRLEQTP